ncbi:hypothetical protein OIE66_12215 [Nonomuraea sp. NBC_01738]|uniref:hypothetical protein n=1 Tax=Nonomuraea sp. NBC_01738 TaxID=2976003 RepID=UPI002E0D4B17|nr:hypothetical protein OIE66_12215 [Nonomuraea sp. NBC_01738]
MNGSWCERPKPQAPSCELPSPFSKPDKPDASCDVPKSGEADALLGLLLRLMRR